MDEKDEDIRWFLKTFPFVGAIIALAMAFITLRAALTREIMMIDSYKLRHPDYAPAYIKLEDQPFDYAVIMALLLTIMAVSIFYTAFRIAKRRELIRQDSTQS